MLFWHERITEVKREANDTDLKIEVKKLGQYGTES